MDRIDQFIRIVSARSIENKESILTLHSKGFYGTSISLLRQELDSLIRVCYLNTLEDISEINRLIDSTINGIEWKKKNGKRITDRKMVNIASQHSHWAIEVYEFGNCFTHLTNFHDYLTTDPINLLDTESINKVKSYLSSYHGFQRQNNLNFDDIIEYIPKVIQKVSYNLRADLEVLKRNRFS